MKNLYKKIGMVALSGVIVAGGVMSSGLNAHAIKINYHKDYERSDGAFLQSEESDIADVIGGSSLYGYEVLQINDRVLKNHEKNINSYEIFEEFHNGINFLDYMYDKGMNSGIYRVKVGKGDYLLNFKSKVPPGIDAFLNLGRLAHSKEKDIAQVKSLQGIFDYVIVVQDEDKEYVDKYVVEGGKPELLKFKEFNNGKEFFAYMILSRPDGKLLRIKLGDVHYVLSCKKVFADK